MESAKEENKEEQEEVKPIFPHIAVERQKNTLVLDTYLRKKFRKKWYLWHFHRKAYVPEGQNDYTAAISGFNRDIYMCMLFGKIDPKATYMDGTPIFELDIDQERTEKERMDPARFFKPEEELI
jgi:hypothetical protein